MREYDTIMCLLNGPKELKDSQSDSKSLRQHKGYTNAIQASKIQSSR
jgi:hypothetical protein